MPTKKEFGAVIRAARKALRMSQAELAYQLGIPQQCLSRWERGTHYPNYESMARLRDILGVAA